MLTAGDLRKLIAGKPDDWEVPLSLAYGEEICNKYVFVRVDDVTAGPTKPAHPPGNVHDPGPAIFVTVSLVDGNSDDEKENPCDLCGKFFPESELDEDLCDNCSERVDAYMLEHDTDRVNAVANLRVEDEADEED